MIEPQEVIVDSAQLYELSLAVGNSIDLHANCDRFLTALATVKQLNYTGVWLRKRLLVDAETAAVDNGAETVVLAYAHPQERFECETIPLDHPAFRLLGDNGWFSAAASDPRFHQAAIERRDNEGAYALFSLGNLGFLKLYARYRMEPFSEAELIELGNLIFKFTISLEGCLAHHRLLREVSLRRRAEAVLRHREEHFRSLIENALDLILVLKYDGTIEFVSPSVERLLGYSVAEMVQQSLFAFVHPDDTPQFMQTFLARAGIPGVSPAVELRFRHGTGSWRTLSISSNNLLSNPAVAGIIMNCHDVTERNCIEEELHLSQERYSLAVRGANDGIWDWDLESGAIYVSSRWMAMLGLDDENLETTFSWWLERVHPDDREKFETCFNAHRLGQSELLEHEYRMLHCDGSLRWMQTRGIAVRNETGKPYRMAGSQTDVTTRRAQQAELEEARRKALGASRAKGEFLANMSHEIRTPMNGVIGMASLLLETDLSVEQRDFVETIRLSGDALLTIVNDILDLSKIESGKLQLEDIALDLGTCIESAVDLMAPVATEKGLELAYLMHASVPEGLLGDATRIRQVLINLLGNAIKFTESGGALIAVRATPGGGDRLELQFSVKDTGIGIDPGKAKNLFDPFSQADASITRKHGGTGLGLAICKRLCELMGGYIWIESTPGQGSTVHFTIRVRSHPAQGPEGRLPELPGRRLLLVDDNPLLREVLAQQVSAWGAQPRTAASGTEALAALAGDSAFDAVLIDLDMPEMDGVVLARAIRGLPQGRGLPLVLLTPIGCDRVRQHDAEGLVDVAIAKPVKPGRLYDALAQLLEGRAPRAHVAPTVASDAVLPHLRVLIAEDNPVNLKVALLMLDRLGYRPDVASDGHEVLAALARTRYDVILMDVQMPNMDGIEATRRIRAQEHGREVQIIAMTAHALRGDRERCLEAGMDGYLTKPVQMSDFRDVFLGITPRRPGPTAAAQPAAVSAPTPVLDATRIAQLRSFADHDQDGLLHALVCTFLEAVPGQLAVVREAARARDGGALKRAAHQLKGGALNLGANAVADTCRALEHAGTAAVFNEVDALVEQLGRELAQAGKALKELGAKDE